LKTILDYTVIKKPDGLWCGTSLKLAKLFPVSLKQSNDRVTLPHSDKIILGTGKNNHQFR
jgi:hypothetical protein